MQNRCDRSFYPAPAPPLQMAVMDGIGLIIADGWYLWYSGLEASLAEPERRKQTERGSRVTLMPKAATLFHPDSGPMAGCLACSSRPCGIFRDLDQPTLVELNRLRRTSTYAAGVTVFSQDDEPRAAYCICSGCAKLSRSSPDGRTVILGIAATGDVLGVRPVLLGKPHDHTAETLEETRLCFIPKDDFLAILKRHGDVSLRLAQKLSTELGEAYRQVWGLVLKPAAERVAELLLALCHTHGDPTPEGIMLKTNMCQDELAELVGVSRRSLTRAIGALRDQGLIECRRRFIIVRDSEALRNCLISED